MVKKVKAINISEIKDEEIWEKFNLEQENASYFQSFKWGEIQKKVGISVKRFGFTKDNKLHVIFQTFEIKAKRGHYLHVRQGPVFSKITRKELLEVIGFLKEYSKVINASFIRISPVLDQSSIITKYLKEVGFINSPIHNVDAENRWILKLDKSLDELLINMRKTTRYMIRHGGKENIKIVRTSKLLDLNKFMKIYKETAQVKDFIPHAHIKQEFEEFMKSDKAYLYLAYMGKKLLGSAIIIYYGREAIYRHGATSQIGRKTSASYLIQWEAIKDAKNEGIKIYNFWGISKDDSKDDPWYGLSQFKMGFGGERKDFIHSLDLPLKRRYLIAFFIDSATRIKKGYR